MRVSPPQELLHAKKTLDKELGGFFKATLRKVKAKDPALLESYQLLEEFCLRGGKRLRGYLVLLGYKMAGQRLNASIYDVAVGVELTHSALLIHDDIIDNDLLRRGKPTLHILFAQKLKNEHAGITAAIQAGDLLSSLALEVILSSRFSNQKKVLCAQALGFGSVSTAVGELMDIVYSHKNISEKSVEKILLLKTARYSVSQPLVLGYLLGGGKRYATLLQKAGEHFGTAFQIRDDVLGVTGAKSYQSRGGDIRESKPFALAPQIAKKLSLKKKEHIQRLIRKKVIGDGDLRVIKNILLEAKIPHMALRLAANYTQMAKDQFARILPPKLKREVFNIIDYVLTREE